MLETRVHTIAITGFGIRRICICTQKREIMDAYIY